MVVIVIEKPVDVADTLAGVLGVSRATAYDMMWQAVKESSGHEARIKTTFDLARRWCANRRTTESRQFAGVVSAKSAKLAHLRNDAKFLEAMREL